uniref:Uncharacterized protein n=1 Tax=Lactuca sativa TaxID=4236 RepID=A0A9R1UWB3_LACSA|nr:hypothetical protein LSAT_V11C700367930 [Lactuca sativa]
MIVVGVTGERGREIKNKVPSHTHRILVVFYTYGWILNDINCCEHSHDINIFFSVVLFYYILYPLNYILHFSVYKGTRTRTSFIFIIGFWMLDLANNTVQRNLANVIFCSWMAIGNILGFLSGSSGNWHRWFPFLKSIAWCEACGNLKASFLVVVIFHTFCTLVTLYFAKEIPLAPKQHKNLLHFAPLLNNHQLTGTENSDSKLLTNSSKSSEVEEKDQVETFNDNLGAVLINLLNSYAIYQ